MYCLRTKRLSLLIKINILSQRTLNSIEMKFDFKFLYQNCIYCHNVRCHSRSGNFRSHDGTVLCIYSFHIAADTPDRTFYRDILRQRYFHLCFTSNQHYCFKKMVNEFIHIKKKILKQ